MKLAIWISSLFALGVQLNIQVQVPSVSHKSQGSPVSQKSQGYRIQSIPEDEARKYIYYPFASYCKEQNIRDWTCSPYCKGDRNKIQTRYMHNQFFNVTGYTAIDDNEKLIIVAFRGSKNFQNWLSNIDQLPWPMTVDGQLMLVHNGFWLDTVSIYSKIKDALIWAKSERPDYTTLFTGHSLGGALAVIAMLMARQDNLVDWKNTKLITFSSPRVGDTALKDFLNSKELVSTRVINPGDIVPNLPSEPLYRHHDYQLLASPFSNGTNCATDRLIDPKECLLTSYEHFSHYHKSFWGEFFASYCE